MSDVVIQKIWEIGKTPVITIPASARARIKLLQPGNYVKIYIEKDKLVIEPLPLKYKEVRK